MMVSCPRFSDSRRSKSSSSLALSSAPQPLTSTIRSPRRPTNEANSRTSAYEALSTLVTHASSDCLSIISKLVIAVLDRSEALLGLQVSSGLPVQKEDDGHADMSTALPLQTQLVGADDRNNYNELQVNICGVVTASRTLGGLPLDHRTDSTPCRPSPVVWAERFNPYPTAS